MSGLMGENFHTIYKWVDPENETSSIEFIWWHHDKTLQIIPNGVHTDSCIMDNVNAKDMLECIGEWVNEKPS